MELKEFMKKELLKQVEELSLVQYEVNKTLCDLEHLLLSTINLIDDYEEFKLEKADRASKRVEEYLLKLKNVKVGR